MPHECLYRVTSSHGVEDREGTCLLWVERGSYFMGKNVAVVLTRLKAIQSSFTLGSFYHQRQDNVCVYSFTLESNGGHVQPV